MSTTQLLTTSQPLVELVEWMGGDLAVVRNARQTAGREAREMPKWGPKLIGDLMRKRHGTPFEAAVLTFRVEVSLAVAREWFRHRVGSFNEHSMRVAEARPTFHLPDHHQVRGDNGRYEYKELPAGVVAGGISVLELHYQNCWETYQALMGMGWSRELARLALPLATCTRFAWTVNARSLMNFLSLRTAPDALREIRDAAEIAESLWREVMPVTAEAFDRHGRVAP